MGRFWGVGALIIHNARAMDVPKTICDPCVIQLNPQSASQSAPVCWHKWRTRCSLCQRMGSDWHVAPPPASYGSDSVSSTNGSFSFALLVKNADLQPVASSLDSIHVTGPHTFIFWMHTSNHARPEEAYRDIADWLQLPGRSDPKANVCGWSVIASG
jgi:hypothetical protein